MASRPRADARCSADLSGLLSRGRQRAGHSFLRLPFLLKQKTLDVSPEQPVKSRLRGERLRTVRGVAVLHV